MRDVTIYNEMSEISGKLDNNSLILHNTITLNRTRLDALEKVLFGSRIRFFFVIFCMVVNPKWARELVNRWHAAEIEDYNRKIDHVKREQVRKSRVIVPKAV